MILTVFIVLFLILWFVSILPSTPLAPYAGWFCFFWGVFVTLKILGSGFLRI